jgi:hypothetical protein
MQPLPFIFIQQAISNPQTGTAHFYFGSAKHEFRKLRKSGKPSHENQESRYESTARRSLSAGSVPNIFPDEVRWKNLLRHLVSLPAGSF